MGVKHGVIFGLEGIKFGILYGLDLGCWVYLFLITALWHQYNIKPDKVFL